MDSKGFTLIEMLLVVAIIGFLVAILLPSVSGVGEGAKIRAAKADLRMLKSAVEVYYISFGQYPPLETAPAGGWGDKNSYLISPVGSPGPEIYSRLIDRFPVDGFKKAGTGSDKSYNYALSPDGRFYIISSDKDVAGAPSVANDETLTLNGAIIYATNAKQ